MNLLFVQAARWVRRCCFAACISISSLANSQIVAFRHLEDSHGDRFRSLGIAPNGDVWIVGERDNLFEYEQALFRFSGGAFDSTLLPPLPDAHYAVVRHISRDGQYIIGVTARNYADEPTLWKRSESNAPRSMGYFIEGESTLPTAVASAPTGPVVVGAYDFGSFIWTESAGYRAWMTNGVRYPLRHALSITPDATKWAGYELSLVGSNTVVFPFVGTETTLKILDAEGSLNSRAFDISPNGLRVCGLIEAQGAIWTQDKVQIPGFGTNFHIFFTISDSGYAGGWSAIGGIVFDPHGRKVHLFDEWWAKLYPATPLPGHVTHVVDLYEYRENLYCLLSAFDDANEHFTGVLAITPLNRGGKAVRSQR